MWVERFDLGDAVGDDPGDYGWGASVVGCLIADRVQFGRFRAWKRDRSLGGENAYDGFHRGAAGGLLCREFAWMWRPGHSCGALGGSTKVAEASAVADDHVVANARGFCPQDADR